MPVEQLNADLFGSPILTYGYQRVIVPSRKGLALVLYLATEARPVTRRDLAALLWGEGRHDNLRQELSKLRRLPGADAWLDAGDAVAVRASTDAADFEQALASRSASRAVALARSAFLEAFRVPDAPAFAAWVEDRRTRYEDLLNTALKDFASELAESGRTGEALDQLHRAIELDRLDESAHRAVMRLEISRGNLQAALEQYETIRRSLREELQISPLEETRRLVDLIHVGGADSRTPEPSSRIPPRLMRSSALVGREREWSLLEQAWSEHKGIFILGPPGIGKTRLMLDFARSRGRYLLNEGYPTDAAFPFSTLARGLRRIHRELPDLDLEPWVCRTLARMAPDLLAKHDPLGGEDISLPQMVEAWTSLMSVVRRHVDALPADDIHWFDAASAHVAEAVSTKLARQEPSSWRHLAAFRAEEMPETLTRQILRGADAGSNAVVEVRPLEEEALADMLAHLEVPATEAFASRLYGYTGGNPLFVVEVLKELYARGKLETEAPTFELPKRVTAIMQRRLDRLEPGHVRLIRAVAITHPDGTPELLSSMLDSEPLAIAEGLGALERDHWLDDGGFVHDLQVDAVMAHMPGAVASHLHSRAAEAHASMGSESGRVAYHLEARGDFQRALPLWLDASKKHVSNELYDEAVALLQKVVDHGGDHMVAHEARVEIARICIVQGEPQRAERAIEGILETSLRPDLRAAVRSVQAEAQKRRR